MEIPMLGADAAKARQTQPVPEEAAPEENAIIEADTAFLVYRLPNGEVVANTDLNAPVAPAREAHPHDIIGMANAVIGDVATIAHAPYIANAVVNTQMMLGRQAAEARQNLALQQELAKQQGHGGK